MSRTALIRLHPTQIRNERTLYEDYFLTKDSGWTETLGYGGTGTITWNSGNVQLYYNGTQYARSPTYDQDPCPYLTRTLPKVMYDHLDIVTCIEYTNSSTSEEHVVIALLPEGETLSRNLGSIYLYPYTAYGCPYFAGASWKKTGTNHQIEMRSLQDVSGSGFYGYKYTGYLTSNTYLWLRFMLTNGNYACGYYFSALKIEPAYEQYSVFRMNTYERAWMWKYDRLLLGGAKSGSASTNRTIKFHYLRIRELF